ncbi:hypothetical protein QM012_002144 [Aureobasidium pullulans]|uniref:MalT-like TPR region domain-containing protein n=1 Tax=Aureobasidium pullulans TaxID=5580 RepID=A0ABR0TB32_AURPU
MTTLVRAYIDLGKFNQAELYLAKAHSHLATLSSDIGTPLDSYVAMGRLATIYADLGEISLAATVFEEQADHVTSHFSLEHPLRLSSLTKLAYLYTRLDDSQKVKKAVQLLETVIDNGQQTLNDAEELKFTRGLLADAQNKLAQMTTHQHPVVENRKQGSLEAQANSPEPNRPLLLPPRKRPLCSDVADPQPKKPSRGEVKRPIVIPRRPKLGLHFCQIQGCRSSLDHQKLKQRTSSNAQAVAEPVDGA